MTQQPKQINTDVDPGLSYLSAPAIELIADGKLFGSTATPEQSGQAMNSLQRVSTVVYVNNTQHAAGANNEVQINVNDLLTGDNEFRYDANTNVLSTGGLVLTNDLTVYGTSRLGNISSIKISGGQPGQFLMSHTANNIAWATPSDYQLPSDWNALSGVTHIVNKPILSNVATTGSYLDLSNAPNLALVATTANYVHLTNRPVIPGNTSQLQNDSGFITSSDLSGIVGTVTWNNVTGKPTIPTNLDSLSDVTITSATTGQVLKYNGSEWVNGTDSTGTSASTGNITFADNTLTGTGDVKIHFTPSASPAVEFNFASNGTLTVPGSITGNDRLTLVSSGAVSGNVASVIADGEAGRVFVRTLDGTTLQTWEFNKEGKLMLPAGGDIVDNAGQSVLGGGGSSNANTGNILFAGDTIKGTSIGQVGTIIVIASDATNLNTGFTPNSGGTFNSIEVPYNAETANIQAGWTITTTNGNPADSALPFTFTVDSVTPNGDASVYLFASGTQFNCPVSGTCIFPIAIKSADYVAGSSPEVVIQPNSTDSSVTYTFSDRLYFPGGEPSIYSSDNSDLTLSTPGNIELNNTGGTLKFGSDGDLVLPAGKTIRDTNGVDLLSTGNAAPQYGYFDELAHTGDNNQINGEAVAMDNGGNSYVSYSYYDNNDSKNYGGVAKFSNTGEKLWSVNIQSSNSDARYPEIASLEYVTINSNPALIAFGKYYDNNISKDVAFMYYINPVDGSGGQSFIDGEFRSVNGMRLHDGVIGIDSNNNPYAVIVGETYEQNLTKTLTPLAGSTVDKLYVSWSDVNASGVSPGEQVYYTDGNSNYGVTVNGTSITATVDGTGFDGISLTISTTEAGHYVITRVNGWGGALNGFSVPQTLRVLGSNLGGVDNVKYTATSDGLTSNNNLYFDAGANPDLSNVQDGWHVSGPGITGFALLSNVQLTQGYFRFDLPVGVTVSPGEIYTVNGNGNDMTFDFNKDVFNNNSNNINAAVSNIQGTPVSNVYCSSWGGNDWSTTIGTALSFNYQLNSQAYIGRFSSDSSGSNSGGGVWTRTIGASNSDRLRSVTTDSNGNAYAVGYVSDGNKAALVVKYDIDGNQTWAVRIDSNNNMNSEVMSVDILSDGSLITVGEYGIVTKLSSDTGAIFWQVKVDDNISWDSDFRGTATPDGDYIFTNYESNNYTMYVMRISGTDGSAVWVKRITRTDRGDNGEIRPQYDFAAQYIDCNATYVTIAGTTQPYSGNNTGLVFSFPIDGENVNGTYGQYVVTSESLNWTTESTTASAATVADTAMEVSLTATSPTSSASSITVTQTSIGGVVPEAPKVISWTNPNNNVWRIETYNGGAAVSYDGSNDAIWWDASNSPSGSNNFRGAIIEYHSKTNAGTIIGTIHIANDFNQDTATHTEHLNGDSDLNRLSLWACDNNRGQLFFKRTDNNSDNLMIQWTARVFYGNEFNC